VAAGGGAPSAAASPWLAGRLGLAGVSLPPACGWGEAGGGFRGAGSG
jgi:hypothetical protein